MEAENQNFMEVTTMKNTTKNKLWVIGVGGLLGGCIGSIVYQAVSIGRIIPSFIEWAVEMWTAKEEES